MKKIYNSESSHHKRDILLNSDPPLVYDYIINSITLIRMINKSYFTFIENSKNLEIAGTTTLAQFFSLDDYKDKNYLQPLRIGLETQQRIIELFKGRTNMIDFSSPLVLEQKYAISCLARAVWCVGRTGFFQRGAQDKEEESPN